MTGPSPTTTIDLHKSQVGYITLIGDKDDIGNIIDFSIKKSRRVVRSVLGTEIFVIDNLCHAAIVIKHDLIKILKTKLEIKVLTDSEVLFNVVIRDA